MPLPVLDPELLQAFVAVADNSSFTRAATVLNRTQSAVSMQIKRLEDRLGVELFERTKANVSLSRAGESLLGYARRILMLSDEAVGRLREHKIEGVVRLGVMEDYGTFVLPPLLARFMADHPQLHVEMEIGLTAPMPARLGASYDLVIAMHPEGRGEGEFLLREQPVWAAGAAHDVEEQRPEEQRPLPLALYPRGCLFRKWAIEALEEARRPWRLAFVSHSLAAVKSVAAQGLAVTVVKAGTFPPQLRALSDHAMPVLPSADICLHLADKPSPPARLLADYLRTAITADATALARGKDGLGHARRQAALLPGNMGA